MSQIVLDASVLIKLYVNEEGSRRAAAAVKKAETLLAPDLLWIETGNILWKYVRRGELNADVATRILADMLQIPILITPASVLLEHAFDIAVRTNRTVYDSLYLATAVQNNAEVLTADQRLVHALTSTALAKFVRGL